MTQTYNINTVNECVNLNVVVPSRPQSTLISTIPHTKYF